MKVFESSRIQSVVSSTFNNVKIVGSYQYVTLNLVVKLKDGTLKDIIRITTYLSKSRLVGKLILDELEELRMVDYEE